MIRNHMNRIVNRKVESVEVSVKWHDDEELLKQSAWNWAVVETAGSGTGHLKFLTQMPLF